MDGSGHSHSDGWRAGFDVVVLAASSGGVAAYRTVLAALPADFPAAVVLVQHRRPGEQDRLAALLDERCALPVRELAPGVPLQPGVVHLAPAGCVSVVRGDGTVGFEDPAGDGLRPADALLRSAAACWGRRLLAVVLTGRLDDGAAGARAVKRAGGRVVVQDPATAAARGMPDAVLATGCVDFPLPVRLVGDSLIALVMARGAAELLRVTPPPWAQYSRAG